MKKKLDKSAKEFAMMQEFWRIWQEYYIPEDNEDYWKKLVEEADAFTRKYNETLERSLQGGTASHLMMAVLTDIEQRFKDNK